MMQRVLILTVLFAAIFSSGDGRADIYRLESDDDVVSFSDSPRDKRYQLVMKEPSQRSANYPRKKFLPERKMLPESSAVHGSFPGRNLPVAGVITSPPGLRIDPFDGKLKHHNGFDIAAPSGTPVKPVASGTVLFSGWKNGYGNTIILDHHDGVTTVYAHHANNNVAEGAIVGPDTVIAFTGSTGRSTGPHLHFEAWRGGANITADFIPDTSAAPHSSSLANAPIRRLLQQDGSILFTNLR